MKKFNYYFFLNTGTEGGQQVKNIIPQKIPNPKAINPKTDNNTVHIQAILPIIP
jgi:hypothetical protein